MGHSGESRRQAGVTAMAQIHAPTEAVSPVAKRSPSSNGRSWLASVDAVLGAAVEIPVAMLVAAEIVILFAGVVARFGFHQPFVWSDELASMLFLWLPPLGGGGAPPPHPSTR